MAAEVPLLPRPRGKSPNDIPAPSLQEAAGTEVLAKRRAEKLKRQEAPREKPNRFVPLAMESEDTIPSIWGDSSTPSSPRASASPMECPPSHFKPQSSSKSHPRPTAEKSEGPPTFPLASLPLHPRGPCDGGVNPTKKVKSLAGQPKGGLPSGKDFNRLLFISASKFPSFETF
ncbi:hypothetical protein PoB_004311700 [Plakobranchus ocellatus]|uniref:Uncharacterized protein n=1 Tax=Plakobranchus ocellatus TaxID=259542 RepID=A0AAV4BB16_9GAST|nr:hypothetical protein PoB_004311700 [Plakobranchus ocellatus]